ncbi:hypothetical protein [Candidatus Nitrosotenuis uzonensis]|uniref:Uncharacterized protein n=1 Tax=Candidatus Nitrosotenuis uzonensis TaxID=1407055 RepID=V6ARU3_9ARCH|nr:hypothetical protein [Candidatus Nitrosotenuis uzonensis]CDI05255.1 hypothetical protein NITUZ_140330 [Candidatus Nitrosotenuis uzonensis]
MTENTQTDAKSEYLSICDIWKDSVHKIITKAEFQTPLYIQAYTQVHAEFLHSIDNIYGTCYMWQKQYFDKLGIDKNAIDAYAKLYENLTEYVIKSMDAYAEYQKYRADVAIEAMKSGNIYVRQCLDMYAKMISLWNASLKK